MRCLRTLPGREDGVIATEVALLGPLLLLLILVLFDLAMAGWLSTQLSNGARAGAQFALSDSQNSAGIEAAVRSAGIDAQAVSSPSFTVAVRRFCECDGGVELACNETCGSGEPSRMFVTVRVNAVYVPLFPYPFIGDGLPMSGSAVLQVR